MKIRSLPTTALTLFLLPLLALSLQGQSSQSESKDTQVVKGITRLRSTNKTVGNVKITFVSEDGKTKEQITSSEYGTFILELPHSRYKVTATHDGYETYSTGKGFVVVQGGEPSAFNIFMLKAGEAPKTKASPPPKPAPGFEITEKKARPQAGFLVEYFKLDHRTANKLVREYAPKAADAQELRDTLGKMVEQGEAELIRTGWARSMSGQRTKTESVREDIYPTEYDPPEINSGNTFIYRKGTTTESILEQQANKVRENSNHPNPQIQISSAFPTAFETRNVGLTLEVDPAISPNGTVVDLSLSPEIVTRLGDVHFTRPGFEDNAHGIDNISLPTFYTMKTTTQITTIPGQYNLLGLHTPHNDPGKRIIVLLRTNLFHAK